MFHRHKFNIDDFIADFLAITFDSSVSRIKAEKIKDFS